MQLDDRNLSSSTYRFGFNGKENDTEVTGQQDYGFRIYDRNLARFKSVDPLTKSYPWNSTFAFAENSPIENIDLDGLESQKSIGEPAHGTVEARDQLSSYTFYDRNRFPIISIIGSDKLGSYATKATQAENAAYLHDRNAMYVARGAEAIKDGGLVTAYFAYTGANVEQLEQVSALENALLTTAAAAKTKTMSGQGAAPNKKKITIPKTQKKVDPNELATTTKVKKLLGAERAAKFEADWPRASLSDVIKRFAPDAKPTNTPTGKLIYHNTETGVQVVHDISGNYFRIEDTNLPGKNRFLDLEGNIPNNKTENGRTTGRSPSEYKMVTHFKNSD